MAQQNHYLIADSTPRFASASANQFLFVSLVLFILFNATIAPLSALQPPIHKPYFGIQVVDDQSGRGVPLVELRTVNNIAYYTDSTGWVAFHEPELMDRDVFFSVASAGYEFPKDGFGNRGLKLQTTPGKTATVKVKRTQIAERLYRITGEGIYHGAQLLGQPIPHDNKIANTLTLGQDSVQAVPYRGKIFWLWGDTSLAHYPLGNFQVTAATSVLPNRDSHDPTQPVVLNYFVDPATGNVARMMPDEQPGAVWLWGLLNVTDAGGRETLVAHYSRNISLGDVAEQGLAKFNDATERFEKINQIELSETWRFPRGNAVQIKTEEGDYFYFAEPYLNTRVRADWKSVIDPLAYEALAFDSSKKTYSWQSKRPPTTAADERELIDSGILPANSARYQVVASNGKPVEIHRASIVRNNFLKKWVLIGTEMGNLATSKTQPVNGADLSESTSPLGEIWIAAAENPTGPWTRACKIATHGGYTFYNPRQHPFFDRADGQLIYFEGTFTRMFSHQTYSVPRYDYNQIMYRIDLDDPRLELK